MRLALSDAVASSADFDSQEFEPDIWETCSVEAFDASVDRESDDRSFLDSGRGTRPSGKGAGRWSTPRKRRSHVNLAHSSSAQADDLTDDNDGWAKIQNKRQARKAAKSKPIHDQSDLVVSRGAERCVGHDWLIRNSPPPEHQGIREWRPLLPKRFSSTYASHVDRTRGHAIACKCLQIVLHFCRSSASQLSFEWRMPSGEL